MNDDTVIGYIELTRGGYREVTVRISDLDEPYRSYLDGTPAAVELALSQLKRIAELEDENKRLREGLSSICDTDTPHTIDRYTRRIAELEAALESMQEAYEGRR